MNKYNYNRVVEPKDSTYVTAWQLDNSKEIIDTESRVKIDIIHIESDSFHQLCAETNWDEAKIMARIMEIVNRRCKLHNPFTNSGGIFSGTVDKIGSKSIHYNKFQEGDEVIVTSTATGIPLYLDEIKSVDFHYGQILVKGYIILPNAAMMFPHPKDLELSYTLSAVDESSAYNNVNNLAFEGVEVLFIGANLTTLAIYAGSLREKVNGKATITAIIDETRLGSVSEKDAKYLLSDLIDNIIVTDLTKPRKCEQILNARGIGYVDMTINNESISGAETLAVLMTKPNGNLYFTSLQNGYDTSILISETMNKQLNTYSLDQYTDEHFYTTLDTIRLMKEKLDKVHSYFSTIDKVSPSIRQLQSLHAKKNQATDGFIFQSQITSKMLDEVLNVAKFDCNIIIEGETGVGKEKVFSLIHNNSSRNSMPAIKINCATISENLAESEFFGYEAGSFTGASKEGKTGYFEAANNGILFLDEIGSLSMNMQSKLLRVLQENQFMRIGGTEIINVNVRVICANNVPLKDLVTQNKFREDLYYRLNIYTISIPPLRERKEDIIALSTFFLKSYNAKYNIEKELSPEAIEELEKHPWPGNVRELENIIHRLIIDSKVAIISRSDVIKNIDNSTLNEFITHFRGVLNSDEPLSFKHNIENHEKSLISGALELKGTTRKAAAYLNMTQAQLSRKKIKYGL